MPSRNYCGGIRRSPRNRALRARMPLSNWPGLRFQRTALCCLVLPAANRDPRVFDDPDRFDIARNSKSLMTFGPGLRTCPGMHLAQKNLETALRIVAERLPKLRLNHSRASMPEGILLRGTASLPVSWH